MRPLLFLLTSLSLSCGGMVEETPQAQVDAGVERRVRAQITRAVYLDPSCESSPAGVAVPPVDVVVTLEHRRDLVVRAFDGTSPSVATRHYVRDSHVDGGCASRETGAEERVYDVELR